jgi:integrase
VSTQVAYALPASVRQNSPPPGNTCRAPGASGSLAWVPSARPVTAAGIYQLTTRRGRQAGVDAYPHRFRHHFSHTWLDRGGPEGDLMELAGWTPRRCSPATAPAPAAPAPAAPTTAS